MEDEECSCRQKYEAAVRMFEKEVTQWARASAALEKEGARGFVPGPIFPMPPVFQRACWQPCRGDVALLATH